MVKSAATAVWIILIGLAIVAGGAYLVYRYRLRVCFPTYKISVLSILVSKVKRFVRKPVSCFLL